jgi:hypothetical protein
VADGSHKLQALFYAAAATMPASTMRSRLKAEDHFTTVIPRPSPSASVVVHTLNVPLSYVNHTPPGTGRRTNNTRNFVG